MANSESPTVRELIEQGREWQREGRLVEALQVFGEAARRATTSLEAIEALRGQANVCRDLCLWDEALKAAREAKRMAIAAGLFISAAEATNEEGAVHLARGELESARACYQEMMGLTNDDRIHGIALQNLGTLAGIQERYDEAGEAFARSAERFERAGYMRGRLISLINSARAILLKRDMAPLALDILRRAESLALQFEERRLIAQVWLNMADALIVMREYVEAERYADRAHGCFVADGNRFYALETLRILGDSRYGLNDVTGALGYYRQAKELAEEIGASYEVETVKKLIERRYNEIASMSQDHHDSSSQET